MGWGQADRTRLGAHPDNGGVPVLPLGLGCK